MICVDDIRSAKIQILRAIAIFCVVMIHTLPGGYIDMPFSDVVIRIFLNFAVAMFLFLSGLLTNLEIKDRKLFIKKRTIRVLIPYIIWTLIYTIVYYSFGMYNDTNLIHKIIYNLFTAKASGALYFIFVYIQLMLITPYLKKLALSKFNWLGFMISIFSIFFIMYLPILILHRSLSEYSMYPFSIWFAYYYLGICLSANIFTVKVKHIKLLLLLCLIFQFIECCIWFLYGAKVLSISQFKISAFLTNMCILVISYKFIVNNNYINLKNNLINFLITIGNYSFGIFLLHILIRNMFSFIIIKKYQIVPIYTCIVFITTFIIVYILSKLVGKKVSKWIGFI